MDLEYAIIIGSIVVVIIIILLISYFLYRRDSRPVFIESLSTDDREKKKKRRWEKAKKKIKNWTDKIQFWKNIKIPNPLGWMQHHKFWTGFILFYLVFLVISLLYEYGIIR